MTTNRSTVQAPAGACTVFDDNDDTLIGQPRLPPRSNFTCDKIRDGGGRHFGNSL